MVILAFRDQRKAIEPAPQGQRKVVLATAIAETSLTIEGVRVVVDAGLSREAVFDPGTGMSRLQTRRLARAAVYSAPAVPAVWNRVSCLPSLV